MAREQIRWADFGWQGIRLRVPEEWNLGRVDGDQKSGYVRLDDAEIVRAEVEWRETKGRSAESVPGLVERYVENLEKKAGKTGISFAVQRRARFLRDKRWLEGRDYEVFTWEADFRAYNLAIKSRSGRVLLLRVLAHLDENLEELAEEVFRSLDDQFQDDLWLWSVYGLEFSMPADFKLESQELKSGHIQLSFQKEKDVCRVQRLSLAQMLLKRGELKEWYPVFFKKQLRDMEAELSAEGVREHSGLRVAGKPRSRWRQLLRPLPFINPRPRQYMDSLVWHCDRANKICVVDHLYRKKDQRGDLTDRVTDGYICHQEKAQAEPRGDAELAARPQ